MTTTIGKTNTQTELRHVFGGTLRADILEMYADGVEVQEDFCSHPTCKAPLRPEFIDSDYCGRHQSFMRKLQTGADPYGHSEAYLRGERRKKPRSAKNRLNQADAAERWLSMGWVLNEPYSGYADSNELGCVKCGGLRRGSLAARRRLVNIACSGCGHEKHSDS